MEVEADAILISQVVTQRDIHLRNLTRMVELVEASGIRNKVVMVAGGPRIDNSIAVELGYDACFGRGSFAEDVATFIIEELHRRQQEV
jgi:beta-lysine 5,6-aminomutase beta subunit